AGSTMRVMSFWRRGFVALAICVSSTSTAAEPPPQAFALADAMNVTRAYHGTVTGQFVQGWQQGGSRESDADCMFKQDFSVVRGVYAEMFARTLTADEMEAARQYFLTKQGQDLVLYWAGPLSLGPVGALDFARYGDFFATPVGHKVLPLIMNS